MREGERKDLRCHGCSLSCSKEGTFEGTRRADQEQDRSVLGGQICNPESFILLVEAHRSLKPQSLRAVFPWLRQQSPSFFSLFLPLSPHTPATESHYAGIPKIGRLILPTYSRTARKPWVCSMGGGRGREEMQLVPTASADAVWAARSYQAEERRFSRDPRNNKKEQQGGRERTTWLRSSPQPGLVALALSPGWSLICVASFLSHTLCKWGFRPAVLTKDRLLFALAIGTW